MPENKRAFCPASLIAAFVLLAGLLNSGSLYSQHDFSRGYIVDQNGDTSVCLVEFRKWDQNPEEITTKDDDVSLPRRRNVEDLRAFHVAGETYQRSVVEVDVSPVKLDKLDNHPEPILRQDTVFLHVLARGAKSLYYLKDANNKEHFFVGDSANIALVYKRYLVDTPSGRALRENNRYMGQLAAYLSDCPSLRPAIDRLRYNASIFALFERYYDCIGQPMEVNDKRRDAGFEFGVLTGATLSALSFSTELDGFAYFENATYDVSIQPVVGTYVDVQLLRNRGLRISNDFLYTFLDIAGSGRGNFSGTNPFTVNSRFKYHFVKWIPTFQVGILREGSLYLSAGFSLAAALKSAADVTIISDAGSTTNKEFESRKLEYGYIGGIGSRIGKFAVEARYEATSGISDYYRLGSQVRRIYAVVRYRLVGRGG